jgi:hypothetical protein
VLAAIAVAVTVLQPERRPAHAVEAGDLELAGPEPAYSEAA